MSDGYNKPQYHAVRIKSAHDPSIGDSFEWNGNKLMCIESCSCSGCFFNEDFRKSDEHRQDAAKGCIAHFCESNDREDNKNVKFVKVVE